MDCTDCSICLNPLSHSIGFSLSCNHAFHTGCIEGWLDNSLQQDCPNCRKILRFHERVYLSSRPFKNLQPMYDHLYDVDSQYAIMFGDAIEQLEEEEEDITLESVIQRIIEWKENTDEDDDNNSVLLYSNTVIEASRFIN